MRHDGQSAFGKFWNLRLARASADQMSNHLHEHVSGVPSAEVMIWQEGGSLRRVAAPQCAAKVIKFTWLIARDAALQVINYYKLLILTVAITPGPLNYVMCRATGQGRLCPHGSSATKMCTFYTPCRARVEPVSTWELSSFPGSVNLIRGFMKLTSGSLELALFSSNM